MAEHLAWLNFAKRAGLVTIICALCVIPPQLRPSQAATTPIDVSMLALIATPSEFDGKLVFATGYLRVGRMLEDDLLWAYPEDSENAILINAVAVPLSPSELQKYSCFDKDYVTVIGVFHSGKPLGGPMISPIRNIAGWKPNIPDCSGARKPGVGH